MSGGEAPPSAAVRARVAACIAAEARGALGLFRLDAAAARMAGKPPLFGGLVLGFGLAERHGFSGLWRLTSAGLAAVRAAREAAAGHAEGAGDGPDAAPGIVAPLLAAVPASRGPQGVPQGAGKAGQARGNGA